MLAHETYGFWKRQKMDGDCQIACADSEGWAFFLENAPRGYYDFKTVIDHLVVLSPRNIAGKNLSPASMWKRVQ